MREWCKMKSSNNWYKDTKIKLNTDVTPRNIKTVINYLIRLMTYLDTLWPSLVCIYFTYYSRKIRDKNFRVTVYVKIFTVKPSIYSNLDPDSSYDVRFLFILYGRKARTESYNFRVETLSKIGPETAQKLQFH